jgi:hypothetical protein
MKKIDLSQEGGCRCGQVRIKMTLPPFLTMACHCTGCQRMTGSAFSLSAAFPTKGFSVMRGEPVIGGLCRGLTRRAQICEVPGSRGLQRIDGEIHRMG